MAGSVPYGSLSVRMAQLRLGRIHLTLRLLTKQNRPELVALIIAGDKFLLRVGALKLDASRQHTEVAYKIDPRSEEHTSELQSRFDLVCRLLLEKKKKKI